MKLLAVLFAVLFSTVSFAETTICEGVSEEHQMRVTVTANVTDPLLSDYKVELSEVDQEQLPVEVIFTNRKLVYGRGISALGRNEDFDALKLVFDGAQAVAMYALVGTKGDQLSLGCELQE